MAKKADLKIRVVNSCGGGYWWFGLFVDGKYKMLWGGDFWQQKAAAIRNAKKFSKLTSIPYDDKIYKMHGC